jgi:NAD(P)-dependent dehydrogenase (short-subunit alcohol dehydrogenase family)
MELDGKVALVTGASAGIGAATARKLHQAGASIGLLSRRGGDLGLERGLGLACDVRDRDAVKASTDELVGRFGRLDIVVANAGIAPMESGADGWQDVIDVNLTGVHHTVEVAKGTMVEQGDGGSIVLISSAAGLIGIGSDDPGSIGYTAAKHAVVGLMRIYANHLAPHHIRVNSIHPTGVNTPMINNEHTRAWLARFVAESETPVDWGNAMPVDAVEPEDIAAAVAWLVSDEARYVTGITLPVDAGLANKR